MDITYKIVKGGLKDIPKNDFPHGIAVKLYNKADEKEVSESVIANFHYQTKSIFELNEITVYHKPYSIYKWLIITMNLKK